MSPLAAMLAEAEQPSQPPRVEVVRLSTSYWQDRRGLHIRRDITHQKRKCSGWQFLQEDPGMIGAEESVKTITNLNSCEDGLYSVEVFNEHRDWESGQIEEYELRLVPFVEPA